MFWPRTLRVRLVLVVVVTAIAPLALLGVWLTSTAARSGETVVRDRLDEALAAGSATLGTSWLAVRSRILDLADASPQASGFVEAQGVSELPAAVAELTVLDSMGATVWAVRGAAAGSSPARPLLRTRLPVVRGRAANGGTTVEAAIDVGVLLEDLQGGGLSVGTVLGAVDPVTGSSLLPIPFDRSLLASDRFEWAGEGWITRRRSLREPRLELVAAAPVGPFTEAFERTARSGLVLLGGIAMLSLLLTAGLTGVMTRGLGRLTAAADAVSRGDLEHHVETGGRDEISRVGEAFNTMTTSLRTTLRELADRQALAAVGEFAASLSHEVRNALSSIRIDLQVSGERLPDDPAVREPQERALREVGRLEETVSGALALARSGRLELRRVNIQEPLAAAVGVAKAEFALQGARLDAVSDGPPLEVHGDAAGLEQLFLNLLLNAAQASGEGGCASVRVSARGKVAEVIIADDGPGMSPEVLERAFEAFYSTRPDGTGLGLSVARRIARVHGGRLTVDSAPGRGTTVRVTLPLWTGDGRSSRRPSGDIPAPGPGV